MAKEFSRAFYKSKAWKETREYIYTRFPDSSNIRFSSVLFVLLCLL